MRISTSTKKKISYWLAAFFGIESVTCLLLGIVGLSNVTAATWCTLAGIIGAVPATSFLIAGCCWQRSQPRQIPNLERSGEQQLLISHRSLPQSSQISNQPNLDTSICDPERGENNTEELSPKPPNF